VLSPRKLECATDPEIERCAYNAAFYELGLRWHWDGDTFERLAAQPCERTRVRQYVQTMQPHLLTAYDADFLADAVVRAKQRCHSALAHCAPQASLRFNWADPRWGEVGI
jgi:hypothetical protein